MCIHLELIIFIPTKRKGVLKIVIQKRMAEKAPKRSDAISTGVLEIYIVQKKGLLYC